MNGIMRMFLILVSISLMMQVPRKVQNAFDRRYPSVKYALWSIEDDEYHLSFEHFGQEKIAIFRYNGDWLKTLVIIEPSKLMFCIRDFIKHEYKDARIGTAYYVVTPTLCEYHVYLERGEGEDVCIEEVPLIFDENCEFLRKLGVQ